MPTIPPPTVPRSPLPFVLRATPGAGIPLDAVRGLFADLRARLGEGAVAAAIAPHRALLSLVFTGLLPTLTERERHARDHASARFLGALPNTGLDAGPMLLAFADALAALLPPHAELWVPEPLGLDPGSLVVLRLVLPRVPRGRRPVVRLGGGSAAAAPASRSFAPTDPIAAHLARRSEEALEALRARLEVVTSAGPLTLGDVALPMADVALPVADVALPRSDLAPPGPIDPAPDRHALSRLAEARGPRIGGPDACDLDAALVEGARMSFGAFGFALALRLAEAALNRAPEGPDAAELHTLAALAALHLAPARAPATDPVVARVDAHLAAALARETEPRRRLHLLFRVCIRAGRGPGGDVTGVLTGTLAVDAAATSGLPEPWRAYLGGWCLNARAFALFRAGRLAEASTDCERALAAVDRAAPPDAPVGDLPGIELDLLRFHLANNLSRLAWEQGDRDAARAWQRRTHAVEARIPAARRTLYRWADPRLDLEDLDLAEARLAAALLAADVEDDVARLAALHHDLGVLHYRRGAAAAAMGHHRAALALFSEAGADAGDRLTAALNRAVSAWRAGALRLAAPQFAALAADPDLPAELLPEVTAARALVAAAEGDPDGAAGLLAAAEASLQPDADPGSTARVSRAAGELWLRLGARDRARAAFAAALHPGSPPEDTLGALLGHWAVGDLDAAALADVVARALALAPDALDDPNAWWELPRLLDAVAEAHVAAPRVLLAHAEPLAWVLRLAAQRPDCAARVEVLRATRAAYLAPVQRLGPVGL